MMLNKGHWLGEHGATIALAVVVAAVYVVEAFFSEGFHHPDEHFQIVEFAQWKLGLSTPASVAWELPAQIRPAVQPCLCMALLQMCRWLGVCNPFVQALALRVVAMALSLTAITAFFRANSDNVPAGCRQPFLLLSFLLWFLPAVNVRFSSESFSGAWLLLCLAVVCRHGAGSGWRMFVIGVLAGLSFAFRYQTAFALVGLLGWALAMRRYTPLQYASIGAGFVLVTLVCCCLDAWFYGQWVFVPYRYFHTNIVEGVASSFGEQPWYAYMEMSLQRPTPVIGVMLVLSLLLAMARHYRHPAVWCVVAFLAGHSLVAHKELRFLFPIVNLLPLMLVWGYDALAHTRRARGVLAALFVVVNVGGLAMMTGKPAAYGKTRMMRLAVEAWRKGRDVYVSDEGNPFLVSGFLEPSFYKPGEMPLRAFDVLEHDDRLLERHCQQNDCVVIVARRELMRRGWLEGEGMRVTHRGVPQWVEAMNCVYRTYNPQWTLLMYAPANENK